MGEGSGVAVSCGVGCRHSSDPEWLWLWCRLEATALIQPLAWEPPHAEGAAQEVAKRQNKQTNKKDMMIGFHLNKISKIDKSIETESGLLVT